MPAPTPRNQQTTAVPSGTGYRIRGRKVWVANAEVARVAIVFAATRSRQHPGSPASQGTGSRARG